ncbi:MAG: 23S rRNA (pseudouridine(1915)-N(3))-methyltransferase RlmH [Mariprofundales bacterium]|nr:23S rRNA (pseudouridine(1915)-N(3))-methyltransferase RlmH [Mariprofundales bacterium]
MQQRLVVVGRGEPLLAEYESRFIERIRRFAPFELIEIAAGRERRREQRCQQEGRRILTRCQGHLLVLFDERGEAVTSQGWADFLRTLSGGASVDYIIGGAGGVDSSLRQECRQCWRLSALTLPHHLARAMVLEQLYRAHTIISGHPYHRE